MSVIFGAYHRMAKKKEMEEKLKKKSAQQREKRAQRAMDAVNEQLGQLPTETPATKVWTFLLDGNPFSIVFYTETLEVYCNGDEVEAMINDEMNGGCQVDFLIGPHKARVSTTFDQCSKDGIVHTLVIDGSIVPE